MSFLRYIVRTSYVVLSCLLLMLIGSLSNAFVLGKEGNYAVLRGSTFRVKCIPKAVQGRELEDLRTTYVWTDEEGKELIDARFTKFENGDLEIVNSHVGDSGTYICKLRPPFSATFVISKIYEHKVLVYELSGHKFVSTVFIDMSKYSMEMMLSLLRDLLTIAVCEQELCTPGNVQSRKCEFTETKQEVCEFSIAYEAVNQMADEKCDEDCVRQKMFEGLKRAETILESNLLNMAESPRGRVRADMKTFDTKHLITCRAGFHLVKSYYKRCFPCLPGYSSEANSVQCNLCQIGFYQENYGKHECDKCEEEKTTDTMGAKSRDECVAKEKSGILGNIKEGIASLFKG